MTTQNLGPTPAQFDFRFWIGSDTREQVLRFKIADAPIDISAYGAVLTIASLWRVVLRREIGSGLTIVDGPNGVLKIDPFTAGETRILASTKYELEMRLPDGTQETWLCGRYIGEGEGINVD